MKIKNLKLKILLLSFLFFGVTSTVSASVVSSPATPVNLTKGLVGHWTFDGKDMYRNVSDRSGSGNTGYMKGFTSTSSASVSGKIGQGLKFDGVDDKITTNSDFIGTNPATITAWIYLKSYGGGTGAGAGYGRIVENGKTILNVNPLARLGFNSDGSTSSYSAIGSLSLGRWYFVTVSRNVAGVANFYINGVINGTANQNSGTPTVGTSNVVIGNRNDSARPFDGSLDDVRVYNRALSASEIKELYNMGSVGKVNVTPAVPNLQNGLVGHWTFDGKDLIRNVADRSGNNNTGYMTNFTSTSTAVTRGKIGQGLKFDGVNDYVSLASKPAVFTSPFTISVWVKTNNTATGNYQIFSSGGNQLYRSGGGTSLVYKTNNVATNYAGAFTNKIGAWVHTVVRYDGTSITLYVNGVAGTPDSRAVADGSATTIGRYSTIASEFWNGSLDDVRVYNRALSASEIKELYNMGGVGKVNVEPTVPNLQKGLVGHWTFDGKDLIRNVADRSGLGNTGYMSGFTSTSSASVSGKLGQGLKFDGVNDYVSAGTSNFNVNSGSLTMWYKLQSPKTIGGLWQMYTSNSDRMLIWYYGSATSPDYKLHFRVSGSEILNSTNTFNDTDWHFVVVNYDFVNDKYYMYVDNKIEASSLSTNYTAPSLVSTQRFGMYQYGSGDQFLNSIMDDVRIYNRALSPSEIKQLYLMGK